MASDSEHSAKVLAALEEIHRIIQDLFILEACRAGIKQQEIRAILGINLNRVTRIGKHVKQ